MKNTHSIREIQKQLDTLRTQYEKDVATLEAQIVRIREERGTELKQPRWEEPLVPGPDPFGGWQR